MERNLPLLRKTMDFINEHPENHNQQTWVSPCGTQFCFAGHAAIIDGADFDPAKAGYGWYIDESGKHITDFEADDFYEQGKPYRHVADHAQEILGLTSAEKMYLFASHRTKESLNEAVTLMEQGAEFDEDEWMFVLPE